MLFRSPEGLEGIDVQRLVHEMLSGLLDKSSSAMQEINDSLALDMAKAAAIPYGQVLSNDEMENIVNSLFLCGNVNYTPDGRSVLCILKQDDIDKMLG